MQTEQTQKISEKHTPESVNKTEKKHEKIAMFLLIGPFIGLIITLALYYLAGLILGESGSDHPSITANLVNIVLGLMGMIFVIGILAGVPIGLMYLNKKD